VELFDYQGVLVENLRKSIASGNRRTIAVLPTGGGKTIVAADMVRSALAKGKRALFLAHRKELIEQCSEKLDLFGVEHGIIRAGDKRLMPWLNAQVGSVQTVVNRDHWEADLVFIDECHRAPANTYQKVLDRFEKPPVIIGLTATPYRLDGRGLGDHFENLVVGATAAELVERGRLMEPEVYSCGDLDLSTLKIRRGDFVFNNADDAMADMIRRGEILDNWKKHANGLTTVVFAKDIEDSERIVAQFREAGIRAAHLDGKTKPHVRRQLLEDLASRKLTVLSNVEVLTEGWDLPLLECVVLGRPTQSRSLYKQMVGRVMRVHEQKRRTLVLDHVKCTLLHGRVTAPEVYYLYKEKRKGKTFKMSDGVVDGVPTVIICPKCSFICSIDDDFCPECESDLIDEQSRVAETIEELTKLEDEKIKRQVFTKEEKQAFYIDMCRECMAWNHNPGWVAHKYKDKFGVWPRQLDVPEEFAQYKKDWANGETSHRSRPSDNFSQSPESQSQWDF